MKIWMLVLMKMIPETKDRETDSDSTLGSNKDVSCH